MVMLPGKSPRETVAGLARVNAVERSRAVAGRLRNGAVEPRPRGRSV